MNKLPDDLHVQIMRLCTLSILKTVKLYDIHPNNIHTSLDKISHDLLAMYHYSHPFYSKCVNIPKELQRTILYALHLKANEYKIQHYFKIMQTNPSFLLHEYQEIFFFRQGKIEYTTGLDILKKKYADQCLLNLKKMFEMQKMQRNL